jgi:hypothetical protein
MADEQGTCHHTHIYFVCKSPVRFSTVKNNFPTAHIEAARGSSEQNRDYIGKFGFWLKDVKHGTKIEGTFIESDDELPDDGTYINGDDDTMRNILCKIKEGYSDMEIIEEQPEAMLYLNTIQRVRLTVKAEEYKNTFRKLDVTYIFGATATGKTRYVFDKHKDDMYRITNYRNPFDGYNMQDVVVFDEFNSQILLTEMLNLLDVYPLTLPCRYADKQALYTTVYIISNRHLRLMYPNVKKNEPEIWNAFARRINRILCFEDGGFTEFDTQEYLNPKPF